MERAGPFPGIGMLPPRPISVILAGTRERFDSITGGRLPSWSDGAAYPEAGAVVLLSNRPSAELVGVLRHELAHLALRWHVGRRVPLWFEEGYASVAAGEWNRYDALRVNWTIARGVHLNLDELDRELRRGVPEADAAYGLATTAVLMLQRWGGARGLGPLLERLRMVDSFDQALRETYYVTEGDFEARWQQELRTRYGWLSWAAAAGLFWGFAGALAGWLVWRRRRRARARRQALEGEQGTLLDDAPTP